MLSEAVLLITWNRPDTTRQVLAKISEANPVRLYVSADGPRKHVTTDFEDCTATRAEVSRYCGAGVVKTRFLKSNHGARGAILGAIDWFFDNEDRGIILEDDSLPCASFFTFSEEMLSLYGDHPDVFQVSGTNHLKADMLQIDDFYFSRYAHIWGFATFKRSWSAYQQVRKVDQRDLRALAKKARGFTSAEEKLWVRRARKELNGRDDNWDSGWNFACRLSNGLAITPRFSLVKNIGFDKRALHSSRFPLIAGTPPEGKCFEPKSVLRSPRETNHSRRADEYTARVQWAAQPFALTVVLAFAEACRRLVSSVFSGARLQGDRVQGQHEYLTVAELFWQSRLFR